MILRKPYAFLIKYFRAINLCLLLTIVFCLSRVLSLYNFVKDYASLGVYNITLNPISKYINTYLYLILILIIIISGILVFLLRKKDKPFITYVYITLLIIVTSILFIYINNYFTYQALKEFNKQMILLIRDLVLIDSLFYYPVILVLIIRSLGIDLKSFGFYEDGSFIKASEEDREEVEVDVAFNKERYIRIIKNKLRYTKYFILEHKIILSIILIITLLIGGIQTYKYFYIENRIYHQNETFTSNYYKIKINNTYLTDKDYTGNIISSENRFFIIVDLDITNLINERTFDTSTLFLYIDNNYYIPTSRYNESFSDMGTTYNKEDTLSPNQTKNLILIYEVDRPKDNANFVLKYQEKYAKDKKMIRIKVKILDISTFKEMGNASLTQELKVPINLNKEYNFSIPNYEIVQEKKYTYESCYSYNCPIYEKTLTANSNKKILFLKTNYDKNKQEFLSFIKKYGKVRYVIDGKEYLENISYAITKYRGSYIYLTVDKKIENASSIDLVFTVRTYQYIYKLKG